MGDDRMDRSFVVDVVWEVEEDLVGADVWVFGRVYAREVLIFK